MDPITPEEFKEALPPQIRKNVTPEVMDIINRGVVDPEVAAVYRENVVGLASVMKEGKFKLNDYLMAVHFVSRKLLGDTNIQAWAKTFQKRYNAAVQRGTSRNELGAVASRYNASKLVTLLMGQTMMPTHILNAPLYQEALNTQAELMRTAKSEKVRCDAANSLMTALKPPEVKKVELDIGYKEDDSVQALRETTRQLVEQQRKMIQSGQVSVRSIAESKLIGHGSTEDGKVVNLDN